MTIVNDVQVFNNAADQGDWTGGTLGDTSGFDPPVNNDVNSSPSIYREGTICQEWVLKENITDGYTYTNQVNNGASGSRDITGGRVVVWWFFITADADLDKLIDVNGSPPPPAFKLQLSSDTGFTTNLARWDASQQIYDLDYYGWYPVIVYSSNPDETVGTIVYSSIDSIGWYASTGPAGTKLSGFDQCHSISYLGGHSQTVTLTNLYDNSITNDLGVVLTFGDFFKFSVNIRLGGGTSTTFNLANQNLFFDNVQPDHNLGFIGISDTGTNHFELSSCGITWNEQTGTNPEIFTTPANFDIFRIDGCSFARGGAFTCRSHVSDADTYVTNTVINNCGQVDPSDILFQNNTISGYTGSTGALLLTDTTRISDISFISATAGSPETGVGHAIYITTPGTYTLTNFTYSGYSSGSPFDETNAVVYNNSGGEVTLNIVGGDVPSVRNAPGSPASTTIIINAVTVRVEGVSEAAAVKVIADETVGTITAGDIIFEKLADADGVAEITDFNYEFAFFPSGLDVIVRARASGLPAAAIQDDNGVYTDETTHANSSNVNDMNLLPGGSPGPVVNEDRYLFGHPEQFGQLKLELSTVGTGGFTITWQYWSGGSPGGWTNLSDVVDGTSSFSVAGPSIVSWTIPSDWATTTINSQGPYYYVRAAYTAGTVSTVPLGRKCALDVNRYIPFVQNRTIGIFGLTVNATWVRDNIATFTV